MEAAELRQVAVAGDVEGRRDQQEQENDQVAQTHLY